MIRLNAVALRRTRAACPVLWPATTQVGYGCQAPQAVSTVGVSRRLQHTAGAEGVSAQSAMGDLIAAAVAIDSKRTLAAQEVAAALSTAAAHVHDGRLSIHGGATRQQAAQSVSLLLKYAAESGLPLPETALAGAVKLCAASGQVAAVREAVLLAMQQPHPPSALFLAGAVTSCVRAGSTTDATAVLDLALQQHPGDSSTKLVGAACRVASACTAQRDIDGALQVLSTIAQHSALPGRRGQVVAASLRGLGRAFGGGAGGGSALRIAHGIKSLGAQRPTLYLPVQWGGTVLPLTSSSMPVLLHSLLVTGGCSAHRDALEAALSLLRTLGRGQGNDGAASMWVLLQSTGFQVPGGSNEPPLTGEAKAATGNSVSLDVLAEALACCSSFARGRHSNDVLQWLPHSLAGLRLVASYGGLRLSGPKARPLRKAAAGVAVLPGAFEAMQWIPEQSLPRARGQQSSAAASSVPESAAAAAAAVPVARGAASEGTVGTALQAVHAWHRALSVPLWSAGWTAEARESAVAPHQQAVLKTLAAAASALAVPGSARHPPQGTKSIGIELGSATPAELTRFDALESFAGLLLHLTPWRREGWGAALAAAHGAEAAAVVGAGVPLAVADALLEAAPAGRTGRRDAYGTVQRLLSRAYDDGALVPLIAPPLPWDKLAAALLYSPQGGLRFGKGRGVSLRHESREVAAGSAVGESTQPSEAAGAAGAQAEGAAAELGMPRRRQGRRGSSSSVTLVQLPVDSDVVSQDSALPPWLLSCLTREPGLLDWLPAAAGVWPVTLSMLPSSLHFVLAHLLLRRTLPGMPPNSCVLLHTQEQHAPALQRLASAATQAHAQRLQTSTSPHAQCEYVASRLPGLPIVVVWCKVRDSIGN